MADKRITDLTLISALTGGESLPVDNGIQSYRSTTQQIKDFVKQLYYPPAIQQFLTGTGTYYKTYTFVGSGINATVGATYTNNGITYTVLNTVSASTTIQLYGNGAPTASGTLTKASGTGDASIPFSDVKAPIYLRVRLVAGGGGGMGSGSGSPGAGTDGGSTTFGTSLLTALGGVGGTLGGAYGGTSTIAAPAIGVAQQGDAGGVSTPGGTGTYPGGGNGGCSPFGGAGYGRFYGGAGADAAANSGSGGGGGGTTGNPANPESGGGGGSGGYIEAIIPNPADSYAWAIGTGGAGGAAATSGYAGGAGGSGRIVVEEHYQ